MIFLHRLLPSLALRGDMDEELQKYIAWPGDDDVNDFDIEGIKIKNILQIDKEVLLYYGEGEGWFQQDITSPRRHVKSVEGTVILHYDANINDEDFKQMLDVMKSWSDNQTDLRLLGAPNKLWLLLENIEDRETWLVLPRKGSDE